MFSRLSEDDAIGTPIESEWLEQVKDLLDEVYLKEREKYLKNFQVYGFKYDQEMVFIISFLNNNEPHVAPSTLFLSSEPKKVKKDSYLKQVVDSAGMILDDMFSKFENESESIFSTEWEDVEVRGEKIFFKISRENVELSIKASIMLAQNPE